MIFKIYHTDIILSSSFRLNLLALFCSFYCYYFVLSDNLTKEKTRRNEFSRRTGYAGSGVFLRMRLTRNRATHHSYNLSRQEATSRRISLLLVETSADRSSAAMNLQACTS